MVKPAISKAWNQLTRANGDLNGNMSLLMKISTTLLLEKKSISAHLRVHVVVRHYFDELGEVVGVPFPEGTYTVTTHSTRKNNQG